MPVIDVLMPQNSMGDSEGVVVEWLVSVGDAISEGAPIATVETAKAQVEIPAPSSGTIAEIVAAEGAEVTAGEALARLEIP